MNSDPLGATQALLNRLREDPDIARRKPAELAKEFNLSEPLVRSVLQSLHSAPPTEHIGRTRLRMLKEGLRSAGRNFADWAGNKCALVILGTGLLGCGVTLLAVLLRHFGIASGGILAVPITLEWLVAANLQSICFFQVGQIRYAVLGGLLAVVEWNVVIFSSLYLGTGAVKVDGLPPDAPPLYLLLLFSGCILGLLTGLFATLLTVVGGYVRMRKEDRSFEQVDRTQLLQKRFELMLRLEKLGPPLEAPAHTSLKFWLTDNLSAAAVLYGFALGAIIAILNGLGPSVRMPLSMNSFNSTGQAITSLLGLTAALSIGFLAPRLRQAIGNYLLLRAGAFVLPLAFSARYPSSPFSIHELETRPGMFFARSALSVTFDSIPTLVAWMGKELNRSADRKRRLSQNDPSALLEELALVEWKLSVVQQDVTVLVVDAAQSSVMKANADPMTAELAFRLYQDWVEDRCAEYGGRVHATAGDGAVVAFAHAPNAFLAARAMQTDITRFNQENNPLPVPFRIRIGLHTGQVSGNIDEVVFTAVIDIAAHLEATSPIGGIAASAPTVVAIQADLTDEVFAALPTPVDGFSVFIAVRPTLDS